MEIKLEQKKLDSLKSYLDKSFEKAEDGRDEKATRYREAFEYYYGRLPKQRKAEVDKTVIPVVRKAVDKVLPSLLNIFTSNEMQAVVYRPTSKFITTEVADAVNTHINRLFLRKCNGYRMMTTAFKEGLITGDVFMKAYAYQDIDEDEIILMDYTPAVILEMLMQEYTEVDTSKVSTRQITMTDPVTGVKTKVPHIKGTIKLTKVEPKIKIEYVPFSELYISGDEIDIKDAKYICHKMRKTVGELIELGFDEKMSKEAPTYSEDDTMLSNRKYINEGTFNGIDDEDNQAVEDELEREVALYEHFVRSSIPSDGKCSKLYRVHATASDILKVEEVDRIPFVHGVPEELPDSFWGMSFYDLYKDYQDQQSYLHRVIMDNGLRQTYGGWVAVKGAYDRQSVLQATKPGAVVEVEDPNALTPMTFQPVSPAISDSMSRLQTLAQEDMATTIGIGLDGGQNIGNMSATTAAMIAHNGDMKDKKVANSFAYTLIRPLFELVYKLMRDERIPIEVEGTDEEGNAVTTVITADTLPSRSDFYIDVNTANDDAVQATQLSSIVSQLSALSQSAPSSVMTPKNVYNFAKDQLKRADIHNFMDYLTDPDTQKPSPEEVAQQQQMEQMQMQKQMELDEIAKSTALANLQEITVRVSKVETEIEEMIEDGKAKRQRMEDQSSADFAKIELDSKRIEAEAVIEGQQGRPVSLR